MSTSMLNKSNGNTVDNKPNSQSNLLLNQQRSQSSSARPSSAGATRNRSNVYGYNRGAQAQASNVPSYGATPAPTQPQSTAGVYGQSYGNQRPSSAGHQRPTSSNMAPSANPYAQATAAPINVALNINQMHLSSPQNPAPTINNLPAQQTSSSNARPRSAGAVRRPYDGGNAAAQPMGYGMPVQAAYQQQQQPSGKVMTGAPMYDQQYNPYTNTLSGSGGGHQRPLSASATSHTTNPQLYSTNYVAEQWNNPYKLQYGNNIKPIIPQQQQQQQVQQAMAGPTLNNGSFGNVPIASGQASSEKVRPSSSNAASKLRQALDLSHKLDGPDKATAGVPIGELAGLDNDGDEGVDDFILGAEGEQEMHNLQGAVVVGNPKELRKAIQAQQNNDDDEMDGKPVDSRSHPEVSMTTPSASLELANGSSLGNNTSVDARNTSLDSFSEDNINIGLTTVPNQFCTKRDALELRKLLLLSAGTRGGIVPSSSAVMDMYMVGKVVGVGSYGKVRAAWHRLTGSKIAIKTYDKAKLKDPAHWKRVHSEIKIMEQLSHPRIARMYEAVETPKRMHLIMECLDGGNLCSYVKAKRRLTEDESRRIFFQILQAVDYLHSLGVSHRDIKLENVLFVNDRDIKLIDFGFSTVCQPGKKLKVFCGTPSYMAPEIVRRVEYEGKPVDIWSLGILLYALLCGCFPFRAKAYPDLYRRIARGTFQIPEELSAPVKDLLRVLLTVDPEQRVTSHTALRHSWLQVQYINAPNMDKLRQEMTTLISEKPADDLDEQVLTELTAFGMTRDEVIRLVLTKTHSSLATLYYLLLDVVVNRRKAAKKSASGANLIQNPNSSNPMSLNAALNAKYARKTVAANPSGATQTLLQTQGGVNNFPSPIVNQAGNTKAMPVTSGPISVTQAVNDAAMLTAQQQQQQFLQQQYLEASNNPADYRTSSRPKSAAQSRVSNLNTLMGSANAAGAQLVNGSTNSSNNSNANPILAGYAAAPNMNPAATTSQRPLSAYAGRR